MLASRAVAATGTAPPHLGNLLEQAQTGKTGPASLAAQIHAIAKRGQLFGEAQRLFALGRTLPASDSRLFDPERRVHVPPSHGETQLKRIRDGIEACRVTRADGSAHHLEFKIHSWRFAASAAHSTSPRRLTLHLRIGGEIWLKEHRSGFRPERTWVLGKGRAPVKY